nr:DEAD/DEAH box helicase [Microbispora sp. GKU 823]
MTGEPPRPCRVVYVSPLKALAVDVERNLRAPLTGIRQTALRMGLPAPDISVAIRSGDTASEDRRRFAARPSDILITTPESLFLILTSQAREALRGVETVIVDEVHAVAGTKRGAHLALTLERLDALLPAPAQRIGLSATVRPVEEVATFLGGSRPATVVQPPSEKVIEVDVVVPVEDMTELAPPPPGADGESPEHRRSIWPHVEEHLLDLIEAHRSTIVFANSRRLSERLCTRLNELAWERRTAPARSEDPSPGLGDPAHWSDAFEELHAQWSDRREGPDAQGGDARRTGPAAMPSEMMAQAGASAGAIPEVVRAHHGSVSKEERSQIEEALKSGRLPAVVATSSLELGIDMGSVDLVACVEAPPSVASGLQRIGRAGHQVGAVSRGVIFPKYRGDLVQTAVVAERMRTGQIEEIRYPRNPLDVLAQQIVAMTALDEWTVDSLEAVVRRAAPYATLPRSALEATLDMLAGRYPSEEFAELRPRIVWDRVTGTLQGRPGAQRLAVTNGGTIPDRGLFGVFLVGDKASRVGELDEEMVYESRVGDVFVLGATSWRIEDITADRVLVSPAPGQPGKLPFWHGDAPGRPAELGRAIGAFLRELSSAGAGGRGDPASARERIRAAGLDDYAVGNLLAYLTEQREATGYVPDDRTLVVERFRDELGDWRVVIHSPFGARVHAPWALAIGRRLRERYGVDVQAVHSDDGIVLRVPDTFEEAPTDVAVFDAEEIEQVVVEELGGSALFASRFRECAGRALLLPRRSPGRRSPLWQQRQRAAHLLGVASKYAGFPVVLETMRECLQDVFDVPGLVELMRDVAARRVRVVEVETSQASPFAASLLFNYIGAFMYEGDAPLAERRAQALALDTALLAELMGQADLRELLDPDVVAETERELARLDRPLRDAEDLADLLRSHGPLLAQDVSIREGDPAWLADLERARRAIRVRVAGHEQWAAVEDAWRLRDALGVPLPVGVPHEFLEAPLAGGPGGPGRVTAPDPARRPGRAPRPHPWAVHLRHGRRALRRGRRGGGRGAAPSRGGRQGGRRRVPPRGPGRGVVRRRGAAAAAAPVAGAAPQGGRTGPPGDAGGVPARLARHRPPERPADRRRTGRRRRPDRARRARRPERPGPRLAAGHGRSDHGDRTLAGSGHPCFRIGVAGAPRASARILPRPARRADLVRGGRLGGPGLPARWRRVGRSLFRRHRTPAAPRAVGDHHDSAARADLGDPERGRRVVLPRAVQPDRGGGARRPGAAPVRPGRRLGPPGQNPRPRGHSRAGWRDGAGWRGGCRARERAAGRHDTRGGPVGPRLGGPGHRRHAGPASLDAGHRAARPPAVGDQAPPRGAADEKRPADRERPLVAAALAVTRRHPAGARAGRGPAGAARRADAGRHHGRAPARRVLRRLPGAARLRGERPVPPGLLRRRSGRRPVRPAGRGRPHARHVLHHVLHASRSGRGPVVDPRPSAAPPCGRARGDRPGQPVRRGPALAGPHGRRDPQAGPQGRRAGGAGGGRTDPLRRARREDPALVRARGGPAAGVQALAVAVKRGALGKLTVERADGTAITDSPLAEALEAAGFHPTPRGLRIRS